MISSASNSLRWRPVRGSGGSPLQARPGGRLVTAIIDSAHVQARPKGPGDPNVANAADMGNNNSSLRITEPVDLFVHLLTLETFELNADREDLPLSWTSPI